MAPGLRHSRIMKRMNALVATVMLTGDLLVGRCHHPTPSAAAVEIAEGAVAPVDRMIMKELVAAFDQAEVALQHEDLEALMRFYARDYNYHGLKR